MFFSPQTLKIYLRRLTNLSTRNKSLLLPKLTNEQFIDWQLLDFIDNKPAFELLESVVAHKKSIKLCPQIDSRSEKVNEISKKLVKIYRTEKFIKEERGSEDLYLAYPFVRGKLTDGTPIHAPLAFFPVTLQLNEQADWMLKRRAENASLNRSFLLAYSHFNNVKLSDDLLEFNVDELSRDLLQFRTELYELLKNSPIEINFNQDTFQNKLQYFDEQPKTALDLLEHNGELKLYPEAVLGIFPQGGSYLAPDYEYLIENVASLSSQESFLINHATATTVSEVTTFTAFLQDASQERALKRIKSGESLVVQGPPGTGKSQLIANLMTDFAARGKRVLLVCQKRVALDVVHSRLSKVGIAPFIALIHDFKNDRAALYKQIDAQIDQIESYQKQNYGLDTIILERQFLQTSRSIEQSTNELEQFKEALYNSTDSGISAKELYLTSNPNAPHISLPEFRYFQFDEKLQLFLQKLNRYTNYERVLTANHLWHKRVNFATIGFGQIGQIQNIIDDIYNYTQEAIVKNNLLESHNSLEKILSIHPQTGELENWLQQIDNESIWYLLRNITDATIHTKQLQNHKQITQQIKQIQQAGILEEDIDLSQIKARLDAIIQARQSFFSWAFYNDKTYFKNLLQKYGLGLTLNDLYKFQQLINNRQKWESLIKQLEDDFDKKIAGHSLSENTKNLENFNHDLEKAQQLHTQLEQSFNYLKPLISAYKSLNAFAQTTKSLINLVNKTVEKQHQWHQFLTDNQIFSCQSENFKQSLKQSLQQDFDLLVEADTLKNEFSPTELSIVEKILADSEIDKIKLFQNSLRLAWLSFLEEKHPILRAVSSLKINQLEQELQDAIENKQNLSKAILLMQLREQTYKDVEFNRLQNRVTYRDLKHQVTKKRKIWSVRKLMEHHADEVFRLVPCWMASPETVSAVFPLQKDVFDLVIFDEASQCYAEYGIPAIYRSKQTVIVGDSKQLAPYDLYKVRYEADNDDENPQLEVESLLDLAKQSLPETSLLGHYRSKSLDLIEFSNKHFYKSKLHLLPDFNEINTHTPAIKYIKVDGVWDNNQNMVEAQTVVEVVQNLRQASPEKSIGVVTFNHQQQQLIEWLLIENTKQNDDFWWAKNIENVQGDECDIIVFSIGYAPDMKGKLRVQFGSLNLQSGENRLNVAITRARERVYIVTSIWPQQLQVEDTLHQGPKLLKAYLQFALNVAEGNYVPTPYIEERDGFGQLKTQLQNGQNLSISDEILVEELPFADLTIKERETYKSLILTDDLLYQQAISAKESHAYLPLQMRQKGWPFERIWSRNWWKNQKVD